MDFADFVLAASTDRLTDIDTARQYADALEFRLDRSSSGPEVLDAVLDLPVLVTNRVESDGGDAPATADRLDDLCRAIEQPAVEAVDIELSTLESGAGERVLDRARACNVSVVVSAHFFEDTPARDRMRDILSRASEFGAVGKLAVMPTDRGDVLDILQVTHEATQAGQTVATMAMGELGAHSRVVAPLYGSTLGYAPLDSERATAPGQYDLETFRSLYESL
jgi:3-dehydroquinate dehydratase-1